jgi:aryl-alcohol dehydrogenase-like predicted oxidoreductase
MNYGISNLTGQPDPETSMAIIETAWKGGIREFDTAQAYGTSEKILGRVIQRKNIQDRIKVTTKLSAEIDHMSRKAVFVSVRQSLSLMGISAIHGLLLHTEQMLQQWDKGIECAMKALIDSHLVETVGISVYSPETAMRALNTDGITAIQIPSNILDRRFEKAGIFDDVMSTNKQIYVRSVFLQGLLFIKSNDLPSNMGFAQQTLRQFESLVEKYHISRLELALGYVKHTYPHAKIIVGAETPHQVKECLSSWKSVISEDILNAVRERFINVDKRILHPGRWLN